MIRLLLISYYWPPCGGPGALRPVKFAKYLPKFGVQPTILTRRPIAYHSLDYELGRDVSAIRVLATETLDPARIAYWLGMRRYRPRAWERPFKQALNFPDNKIFWLPFACAAGVRCAGDAVMVTAPPFSSFLAGYVISRRRGIPLLLDFRDAWLEFPFLPYRGRGQRRLVAGWEKKMVEAAQAITVVDEELQRLLARKYPSAAARISVLPNGFDPADFTAVAKPERFTIAYLGTIRAERDPGNLLRAVNDLIREGHIPTGDMEVVFIGQVEEKYQRLIRSYSFTRLTGHLSYGTALHRFSAAHLAVLITTGADLFFPSRQLEYLASGLPILVAGESRGVHRLAEAFALGYPGWILPHSDVQGMKRRILEIYRQHHAGEVISGQTPFAELTRENIAQKLAQIVRTAVTAGF